MAIRWNIANPHTVDGSRLKLDAPNPRDHKARRAFEETLKATSKKFKELIK